MLESLGLTGTIKIKVAKYPDGVSEEDIKNGLIEPDEIIEIEQPFEN
jgi:hypothetical protein